ncbi:M1 family metallopeptidase [Halomonas sp. LS-001]
MRLLALLCGLGLWVSTALALEPENGLEKSIEVTLHPEQRLITGTMRLNLPDDIARAPLAFTLAPGLTLKQVKQEDALLDWEETQPSHYRLSAPDTPSALTLSWEGQLASRLPGGGYWSADNLWLPAQLDWYPQIDDPAPYVANVSITTPERMESVVSGNWQETTTQGEKRQTRFAHPEARQLSLAAGNWQASTREAQGVTLRTLFPKALSASFATTYLDATVRALQVFQQRLGAYPYSSFTIAASARPIGFAFAGFTLLGEQVIALPFIPHTSLPHELMHGWWGTAVQAAPGQGNWSEALTTYLADYTMEALSGEAHALRQRWLTDLNALPDVSHLALSEFGYQRQPQDRLIGYQHGAMLFYMLEQQIGTQDFNAGLRKLIERHRYGQADWNDLQSAFEASSGQALDDFFHAWVEQPGRPRVTLDEVQLGENDGRFNLSITLGQHSHQHHEESRPPETLTWPLRIPVDIHYQDGQTERHWLSLEGRSHTFTLTVTQRPEQLYVDPNYQVLRQLPNAPATLRDLTLDPDTRWLRLGEHSELPLPQEATALSSPPDDITSTPLWVIGTPDDIDQWWDDHPLDAPARLPTSEPAQSSASRLWRQPGTQLGIISAATPEDAMRLMRGLRHWGSASYVVLTQDGTQRGNWKTAPDLRHTFD